MTIFSGDTVEVVTELIYGLFTSDSKGIRTASRELAAAVAYTTQAIGDVLMWDGTEHTLMDGTAAITAEQIEGIVYEIDEDDSGNTVMNFAKRCGVHRDLLNFSATPTTPAQWLAVEQALRTVGIDLVE